MAIRLFADKVAKEFFVTGRLKKKVGWAGVAKIVRRKLDMLDYANQLDDLKAPPGNRLEKLKGDLKGFYSIRVNDQWRIIFQWVDQGAWNVSVQDYHS